MLPHKSHGMSMDKLLRIGEGCDVTRSALNESLLTIHVKNGSVLCPPLHTYMSMQAKMHISDAIACFLTTESSTFTILCLSRAEQPGD